MKTEILKIERKINAEPSRLFRAWLDPGDFSRWFLPEAAIGIGLVELDARPGGKFRIDMLLNGQILPHEGEYLHIEEPTKLVFTWRSEATGGRDTIVSITFTDLRDGKQASRKPETLITLTHERLEGEFGITSHRHGWTNILLSLENRISQTAV